MFLSESMLVATKKIVLVTVIHNVAMDDMPTPTSGNDEFSETQPSEQRRNVARVA